VAGCSTAPVPFGASEAGQTPGDSTPPIPSTSMMATPVAAGPGTKTAGSGTVLGDVKDIPVGSGVIYTAEKVVVTQPVAGKFHAFSAVCTHVGCIVNQISDGTIDCPCHGSEFRITNGSVVTGPAPTPLPKKKIKIEDGKVVLL
jgi:Rieske Fe-S protein